MPVFTQSLQKIDPENPQDAIKKMANHMKYLQEQLEYTLLNLDSRNITEIDTDKTTISDSTGSASLGSYINLTGPNGESFKVGKNSSGRFEFSITGYDANDKRSKQVLYLNSSGDLVITNNVIITENVSLDIDGGEW